MNNTNKFTALEGYKRKSKAPRQRMMSKLQERSSSVFSRFWDDYRSSKSSTVSFRHIVVFRLGLPSCFHSRSPDVAHAAGDNHSLILAGPVAHAAGNLFGDFPPKVSRKRQSAGDRPRSIIKPAHDLMHVA